MNEPVGSASGLKRIFLSSGHPHRGLEPRRANAAHEHLSPTDSSFSRFSGYGEQILRNAARLVCQPCRLTSFQQPKSGTMRWTSFSSTAEDKGRTPTFTSARWFSERGSEATLQSCKMFLISRRRFRWAILLVYWCSSYSKHSRVEHFRTLGERPRDDAV